MYEPIGDLSKFLLLAALLAWPLAFILIWFLKRRWTARQNHLGEASSEEMLAELRSEYSPQRKTVIRTQTEYLPYVLECILENIDSGLDDPQVRFLLERIEFHRPGEERHAMFVVEIKGQRSDLHLRWTRDASDRIALHVQGAPPIIRALKEHKKHIPKAALR